MRFKFVVAYDGTDFKGWARSPGNRTVHEVLTQGITRLIGSEVELIGASRTDSGAHAKGQVCHFETDVPIAPDIWPRALNRLLPPDLAVVRASIVGEEFHSRFCAEDRWYRYRIRTATRHPLLSRWAHDHGRPLDVARMREAADFLVGRHDFRAFTEELQPHIDNTVRTLRRVRIRTAPDEIRIDIGGTAFLRGMMRRMAGALLEIGAGRRAVDTIPALLSEKRVDMHWPVVLPAKGLTLMRVRYANPPIDHRSNSEE